MAIFHGGWQSCIMCKTDSVIRRKDILASYNMDCNTFLKVGYFIFPELHRWIMLVFFFFSSFICNFCLEAFLYPWNFRNFIQFCLEVYILHYFLLPADELSQIADQAYLYSRKVLSNILIFLFSENSIICIFYMLSPCYFPCLFFPHGFNLFCISVLINFLHVNTSY